jgi:hypothetical protein
VAQNIADDSLLSRKAKKEFFAFLEAATTPIDNAAEEFFHTHQLMGPRVMLGDPEVLGRLVDKDAFVDHLVHILDDDDLDQEKAEVLLEDWLSKEGHEQLQVVRDHAADRHLSRYIMWSFRNPSDPSWAQGCSTSIYLLWTYFAINHCGAEAHSF